MNKKERAEPLDREPLDEAGSIGEEQMPEGSGPKTDKHVWNYAADRTRTDTVFGAWLKKFFGRAGEH